MTSYNWLDEFQAISTYYQKYKLVPFRKSILALRSCIEADEPDMLYEITGSFRNACIFALILCFSSRPSIRCIQSLISQSVPLNESFTNNPFNCTPQEYLDTYRICHKSIENGIYLHLSTLLPYQNKVTHNYS